MNDFYLGLLTGIAIVNWNTLSWVFAKTTQCCVRQALRNLDALDLRVRKTEFHLYEDVEPEPTIPKPAWQVEEESTKTEDEQPADESDGDSEDASPEGSSS